MAPIPRAYIIAYLLLHPKIHQELTFLGHACSTSPPRRGRGGDRSRPWARSRARPWRWAVTEELERRAMAGDAALLASHWLNAEEIAGIADDLFLPEWITGWIDRHRPSTHPQPTEADSR